MSIEDEFQSALRRQEQLRAALGEMDLELARLWDALGKRTPGAPADPEPAAPPPPTAPVSVEATEPVVAPAPVHEPPPVPEAVRELPWLEPARASDGAADSGGQLEMRLGTYWFVRVGVVMLLTGFVFLANYARERFFNALPPVGKLGVLYGLAFGLLGTGLWLERRREELRNFARVLAAGGVAAVYYTTFAAYKVETLRVIESPVLAGTLLLFWAIVMIAVSQRRQSQSLALMSILMAYFTCVIIDRATLFSLFSALLLTGAGIALLLRNRWIAVSFASLAGTYLTFAYWRSPQLIEWMSGQAPVLGNFWAAYGFLLGYWLLFTFAVFAVRPGGFDDLRRTLFATLNNGAFVVLGSLGMLRHHPDDYGPFLLAVGAALLGLTALARKRFPEAPQLWRGYLVGGVLVGTLGAIMHFTGFSLALVLASESIALLLASRAFGIPFLRASSFGVAGLSFAYALNSEWRIVPSLFGIFPANVGGIPLVAALAQSVLLAAIGWIARRGRPVRQIRRGGSYGALLGLATLALVAAPQFSESWKPALLAGIALACAVTLRPLRFPELALFGQALALAGGLNFLVGFLATPSPVGVIPVWGVPLFLAYWWKGRASDALLAPESRGSLRDLMTIAAVVFGATWLVRDVVDDFDVWLTLGGILGLALLVIGMLSRLPSLAAAAQAFTVLGILAFASEIGSSGPAIMLVPVFLTAAAPLLFGRLRPPAGYVATDRSEAQTGTALWWIVRCLPFAALAMTFAWVLEYIDADWRALTFAGLAFAFAPFARRTGNPAALVHTLASLVAGTLVCAGDLLLRAPFAWQHGLFCLAPGVLGVLLGKDESRASFSSALAALSVLLGWRYLSGEIALIADGFYLTVAWALYAFVVFGVGLALRDRTYRWLALGVLGAAVVRLLTLDVWGLEPVPRIFSFIATGLVLVSLGFVYNRYQGFIRRYL